MDRIFLKIVDDDNYLEIRNVGNSAEISITSNEDNSCYLQVFISIDEIQEVVDFLTKKKKELERIITERKG